METALLSFDQGSSASSSAPCSSASSSSAAPPIQAGKECKEKTEKLKRWESSESLKESRGQGSAARPPVAAAAAKRLLAGDETLKRVVSDIEQLANLRRRNEELRQNHWKYVEEHEELRAVLNDFAAAVLVSRPDDIYAYAKDYFSCFIE